MILDRKLQRQLLDQTAAIYPDALQIQSFDLPEPVTSANLKYLEEHGLLRLLSSSNELGGQAYRVFSAEITAKGLDFLAQDGGLSAILNPADAQSFI